VKKNIARENARAQSLSSKLKESYPSRLCAFARKKYFTQIFEKISANQKK